MTAKKKTARRKATKGKTVPRVSAKKKDANEAAASAWLGEKRGRGRPPSDVEKVSMHAYVPVAVHRAARIRAFEEGRAMSNLVEEAICAYLGLGFSS